MAMSPSLLVWFLGSAPNQEAPMKNPTHPENTLLDLQRQAAPLVYLAQYIEESGDVSEQMRVLCQAVEAVYEQP